MLTVLPLVQSYLFPTSRKPESIVGVYDIQVMYAHEHKSLSPMSKIGNTLPPDEKVL